MEVARRHGQDHDEEQANTRVHGAAHGAPQHGMAHGAGKRKRVAHKVELGDLVGTREEAPQATDDGMETDIEPAADGILGRVLPRLEAIAVAEVMRWFPVVEDLVAVLDGRKGGREEVGREKSVKGCERLNTVGLGRAPFERNASVSILSPGHPSAIGQGSSPESGNS